MEERKTGKKQKESRARENLFLQNPLTCASRMNEERKDKEEEGKSQWPLGEGGVRTERKGKKVEKQSKEEKRSSYDGVEVFVVRLQRVWVTSLPILSLNLPRRRSGFSLLPWMLRLHRESERERVSVYPTPQLKL